MKVGLVIVAAMSSIVFTPMVHSQQPPDSLRKCQTCHGKQLIGKKKSPSIVNSSYEELYASLTTEVPKKMQRVANKLTDEQKSEISAYIFNLEKQNER